VRLWREAMGAYIASGRYSPGRHLLVLDGIPRNVPQAELLSDSINVVCIVHLVCANEDQMIERLKRRALAENRADDADEAVIRHRFEVYHRQSRPVLDYYPHKLVLTVEALATPEEVAKNIQGGLAPLRRPNVAQ